MVLSRIAITTALLVLAAPGALQTAEPSIDEFFQSFTDRWMRHSGNAAARYFKGAEQDALERQILPNTEERREKALGIFRDGLKRVKTFDRAKLTPDQRLSADVLAWDLQNRIDGRAWRDYDFPLVQSYGTATGLVSLLTVQHPMVTPRDAENYIARLAHVAPRMLETVAEADRLIKKGFGPPKFILEASIAQMKAFVSDPPMNNALVTTPAEKMKGIGGLDDARQTALRLEAQKITEGDIYPAWRKAIALLEAALPKASNDAGLWRLKNGDKAYALALRVATTTKMTPDQIHETGLRMVAEIEAKIDAVLRKAGLTEGSVAQRAQQFWARQPQYAGPTAMADRQADIEVTIRDAQRRSELLFDRVPKLPVVAQPYPAFMGQRAASYNTPPADGSRPGTFQYTASAGGPKGRKSTIYHETVPGHHFQLALQVENTSLVKFRSARIFGSNSAFSEGWGLYAERLAAESGWYEGDLAGELDQLQQEVFRARRLVVDTGLHAKRWTRQQAIDYLGNVAEVERYVVMPGQACSYMIGQLKFIELRDLAARQLGPRFSLKDYHNLVLTTGTVPLDVLEQIVKDWIASKQRA